jgi:hypothetical protein
MSTNANVFNSRVTSEALEKKFRDTFPAQGGAELIQDLFASGVIVPTVDFTAAAEGSALPTYLQTAWDFSTGSVNTSAATSTLISNTGFWLVDTQVTIQDDGSSTFEARLDINDGLGNKTIYRLFTRSVGTTGVGFVDNNQLVVFLRAGDSLTATSNDTNVIISNSWRQVADISGNLVNPLGFTFS